MIERRTYHWFFSWTSLILKYPSRTIRASSQLWLTSNRSKSASKAAVGFRALFRIALAFLAVLNTKLIQPKIASVVHRRCLTLRRVVMALHVCSISYYFGMKKHLTKTQRRMDLCKCFVQSSTWSKYPRRTQPMVSLAPKSCRWTSRWTKRSSRLSWVPFPNSLGASARSWSWTLKQPNLRYPTTSAQSKKYSSHWMGPGRIVGLRRIRWRPRNLSPSTNASECSSRRSTETLR